MPAAGPQEGKTTAPEIAAFGLRLRQARLAARSGLGYGQRELAAMLGVSQAAVSDYERGRRQPGLEMLTELGRLLGVSIDWLLTGGPAQTAAAPATAGGIFERSLADLLGVRSLPYLGRIGVLASGVMLWEDRKAADELTSSPVRAADQPLAAETAAPYGTDPRATGFSATGSSAARSSTAPSPSAATSYVLDGSLASDAEAIARYVGPAVGPLLPGDIVLIARRPGRQGFRLLRRASRSADPTAPALAVEEMPGTPAEIRSAAPCPTVTAGERIIGVLRWF